MRDIKKALTEAAEHLDHLYEDSKHVPEEMTHDRAFRVGLVRDDTRPVAQFYYSGAAEVFLTLGPAVLPVLSQWLRTEAYLMSGDEDHERCTVDTCSALAAMVFAEQIIQSKE